MSDARKKFVDSIMFMTKDPNTGTINGQHLPVLTSLLHRVCDNDDAKFQEADRLINILINAALDKREEEIINAALYRPNPEPEPAGLLHGKPATAQQLIEANRNAGNITLQEFVDTILSPAMERLKSKHPEYTPEPSLWRSDPGKEHTMSPGSTGRILSLRFMIIYPGSRVSDLQLIKGDAGDPNIVVKIPNEVLRKIHR